jgi:hypothetical protein
MNQFVLTSDEKICTGCGCIKHLDKYPDDPKRKGKKSAQCTKCVRQSSKKSAIRAGAILNPMNKCLRSLIRCGKK